MNAEGFCESWTSSCISVHSWLSIFSYMWNIFTWSIKYLVSYHYKWWTWPGRGQLSTAFWEEDVLGCSFSFLPCSGRSAFVYVSSWSWSAYSVSSFTCIDRNIPHKNGLIRESTQVSSGQLLFYWPEPSFHSSASPNTNKTLASYHPWTLHAAEVPWEVYLSSRVFGFAWLSCIHLR